MWRALLASILALAAAALGATSAKTEEPLSISIRDHRFQPAELRVPAGKRVSVFVSNDDATPEEFESGPLKVEKVIAGNSKALLRIGPLEPGRYAFIGEFHADTAKGTVVVE
jgi:plastocyanin